MGYVAKLTIPKIDSDENLLLYVYRSTDSNDINTISKVSQMRPVIVINQSEANTTEVNNKECFVVEDRPSETVIDGITYNGPQPNTVPIAEYETEINIIKINTYTFVNELVLKPLELNHKQGIMYYYSVIAVNPIANQMSHLSKVNGVLINYIATGELNRQLFSCNDYKNSEDDVWEKIGSTIPFDETTQEISIGNVLRPYNISRFGIPVVETVPKINYIHVSLNSLISNTFMVFEVENPWQNNNKEFNYRKLKSYKVRNTYGSSYGEFSVPTYQSILPVSIEKMIIMMKENPENRDDVISITDKKAKKIEIIRRDGIYYNKNEHKSLGYNKWNIPLEENSLAVFSESSIQDTINIQISAVTGNLYVFDIYLLDVYQNMSENTHYVLET